MRRRSSAYSRVIPRDLFNEAKLLKCLGRLSLLAHNELLPVRVEHRRPERGFVICQRQSDGSLYCANLVFRVGEKRIRVFTSLNSRESYPLLFYDSRSGEEDVVFDEAGEPTSAFRAFVAWLQM